MKGPGGKDEPPPDQVDRRVPLAGSGSDERSNLPAVHDFCHRAKTGDEVQRRAKRRRRKSIARQRGRKS